MNNRTSRIGLALILVAIFFILAGILLPPSNISALFVTSTTLLVIGVLTFIHGGES